MAKILQFPSRTYTANLVEVGYFSTSFKVAGTLDGFIDLATPDGTWPLTLVEAKELSLALAAVATDVEKNCLYDRDVLLAKK
jgi:hypothetical protein